MNTANTTDQVISAPNETDEQAASLAALLEGAAEPEKAIEQQAQAEQNQQAQAIEQQIAENAEAMEMAWTALGGLLPEKVAARYGPEQRANIARTGTMLAAKRGWKAAAFFEKWGIEIAFGAALVGPAVPVIIETIKERREAKKNGTPLVQDAQPAGVLGTRTDNPLPTGGNGPTTAQFGAVVPS